MKADQYNEATMKWKWAESEAMNEYQPEDQWQ